MDLELGRNGATVKVTGPPELVKSIIHSLEDSFMIVPTSRLRPCDHPRGHVHIYIMVLGRRDR